MTTRPWSKAQEDASGDGGESALPPRIRLLTWIHRVVCRIRLGIGAFSCIGLLHWKTWGRTLIIVLSSIPLPLIPVGTAPGADALWALLGKDAKEL